jgi:hypothetical protein
MAACKIYGLALSEMKCASKLDGVQGVVKINSSVLKNAVRTVLERLVYLHLS